jgi:hypothetical protein
MGSKKSYCLKLVKAVGGKPEDDSDVAIVEELQSF